MSIFKKIATKLKQPGTVAGILTIGTTVATIAGKPGIAQAIQQYGPWIAGAALGGGLIVAPV